VAIRPYLVRDVDALVQCANDREVWRNLRDRFPHPYTKGDARDWIDQVQSLEPVTNFAITVDGQFAGGIGLALNQDVHRLSAEIGYWLGKKYWGQGVMSKLLRPAADYFFAQHEIVRIYAVVFDWNPASARVLEKAGFEQEGRLKRSVIKDGIICDQLLYALVK